MEHEIVLDRKICGGKACLKGTRIRVIDIVERYKLLKEKPEEIATAFDIPIDSVFTALSYYYKHTNLTIKSIAIISKIYISRYISMLLWKQ